MIIDTLIILNGYLVLVWFCEIKFKLWFILYFSHVFMVCFQCFKNLQVISFMMLLPIIATCR